MQISFPLKSAQQGVVIIETMIAILIFSFAVLGIVGLQATMVKNTTDAKYRADASYIAQQRLGRLWTDPTNLGNNLEAETDISSVLPGGLVTVTQPVANQIRVTVGWTAPGETPPDVVAEPCLMLVAHCYNTIASINGD
jgi:type IV pilus assembly protein PilV